jgi:hypothetical protein
MAKKKINPLLIIGSLLGGLFLINKVAEAKGKEAVLSLFRSMDVSSKTVIPPNKRWRVILKNGTQTEMNSALLQNAIESKAVKTYSLIPETA